MHFDPKTNKYPYPEDTAKHYLEVKKDNGVVFDKDYPYIDTSKSFLFKQKMVRILLRILVFPIMRIRLGLKINGREKIKQNKEILKKGFVSCCNHVHMWDYIGVMRAILPFKPHLLAWGKNVTGENGTLIRMVGGIPIPEGDLVASMAFINAVENALKNGEWIHIYGEGSMWEYYRPIRPLKKGVAHFAVSCDRPILPITYTYRKPGWIRRVIFKQIACFTINIGDLLYKNDSLDKKEQEIDLTIRTHEAMCALAGYGPGENPYEPIYNDSKRVDYYTDKYGVGYKGSW